jgi:DivIVA domain-containing protein
MPLAPEDVVRKSFRPARLRGGYNEEDVDAFLDEVVGELTRLRSRISELEDQVATPSPEVIATQRMELERQQLDRMRAERQELVAELGGLRQGLEHALTKKTEAEQRAAAVEQEAAEALERVAEATAAEKDLQQRVADAQALYEDITRSNDSLVAELRSLRVAAETDAAELFGETPAEPPADATSADDVAVITTVARRIHDEHVRVGQDEAARVVADAEAEAARVLEEASAESQRLVAEATERAEAIVADATTRAESLRSTAALETGQLVSKAQEQHDALLRTAQEEHDRLLHHARTTSERLVSEAEAERAGILADLQARQEVLERRLAELDSIQSGLRDRLRLTLTEQLTVLEDDTRWVGDGRAATTQTTA